MTRTLHARTDALVAVRARLCAPMHGYRWQTEQTKRRFISTAVNGPITARRLPEAPT